MLCRVFFFSTCIRSSNTFLYLLNLCLQLPQTPMLLQLCDEIQNAAAHSSLLRHTYMDVSYSAEPLHHAYWCLLKLCMHNKKKNPCFLKFHHSVVSSVATDFQSTIPQPFFPSLPIADSFFTPYKSPLALVPKIQPSKSGFTEIKI